MEQVFQESEKNNISPTLLMSVIYIESGWDKTARSHMNACGLTQVIPKYTGSRITKTKKYTCSQLKNPSVAIAVGAKTLSYWINKYGDGNFKTGLCGYAAGFRCKGKKISSGGMRYARKVLAFKYRIEKLAEDMLE